MSPPEPPVPLPPGRSSNPHVTALLAMSCAVRVTAKLVVWSIFVTAHHPTRTRNGSKSAQWPGAMSGRLAMSGLCSRGDEGVVTRRTVR
jgi:hypothetical protein